MIVRRVFNINSDETLFHAMQNGSQVRSDTIGVRIRETRREQPTRNNRWRLVIGQSFAPPWQRNRRPLGLTSLPSESVNISMANETTNRERRFSPETRLLLLQHHLLLPVISREPIVFSGISDFASNRRYLIGLSRVAMYSKQVCKHASSANPAFGTLRSMTSVLIRCARRTDENEIGCGRERETQRACSMIRDQQKASAGGNAGDKLK